jgi:hypothetical protein
MASVIVNLRANYQDAKGGMNFRGESVAIESAMARALIERGAAVELSPPAHTAITKPADLKGFAKLNYLRHLIRVNGGTPEGRSMEALRQQLHQMGVAA